MLANAIASALLNVVVLAGIPFLIYYAFHRRRHGRGLLEVAERAGLRLGGTRYLLHSALFALATVGVLVIWPPPLEPFLREGSPQRPFAGIGLSARTVAMALIYGVLKTGFAEELLFRGLIAGSLARRLSNFQANFFQALIFLVPHLFVLRIMPEMWPIIPIVFLSSLFFGWVRIKSDSMVGPWLIHGTANTAMCLSVAGRTAVG